MPGAKCIYYSNLQDMKLEDIFGFVYCEIESCDGYIGLLPTSNKAGTIILPKGKWKGWYFSKEIKFAIENKNIT